MLFVPPYVVHPRGYAFGSRTIKRAPSTRPAAVPPVLGRDLAMQRLDDLPADRQAQAGVLAELSPFGRSE